jgi:hypothetical protein
MNVFFAQELKPFTEDFGRQSQSPSVASVTSVRCFPPINVRSRPGAQPVHRRFLATNPNPPSVTSVTSVRCFPPINVFLAQELKPFTEDFWPPIPIPSVTSATSVTSVRCFIRVARPPTESSQPTLSHPANPGLSPSDQSPGCWMG